MSTKLGAALRQKEAAAARATLPGSARHGLRYQVGRTTVAELPERAAA
jgi:hypothetical protein